MTFSAKDLAPFQNLIQQLLKEGKGEFDDWFGIGLSDYINDRFNKFSNTNTFLFRNTKVPFYDVYFSLTLSDDQNNYNSDDLYDFLFLKSNCSAIIGIAGSGKSMLMKYAFLEACRTGAYIPIFIELRDLNNLGISLIDFIYHSALKGKIKGSSRILERSFSNGDFIFFLDGFDEVGFDIKDRIVNEIDGFIDQYPNNKYLLSSRPGTNIESIPRFNSFEVLPLENHQIFEFIEKQMIVFEDEDLKEKLKATCSATENNDYIEYLSNPLLLSMFILTFRSYPELPKSKSKFYWNVFDTLCTKHDSINKKGGYIHDKKTKLSDEEFEKVLKWFSFVSIIEDKYNFDEEYLTEKLRFLRQVQEYPFDVKDLIYDLSVSISILISEGLEYKFPHRTLQDYFMTRFIKDQSEDLKKSIYQDKFKKTIFPYQGNKNIFDLCVEIDKINFYKYYLIPLFEDLSAFVEGKTVIDFAVDIIKKLELGYRYVERLRVLKETPEGRETKIESRLMLFVKSWFLPVDISSYFNIGPPYLYTIKIDKEDDFIREVKSLEPESEQALERIRINQLPDDLIKKFILTYLDISTFDDFKNKMKTTENLLKDELAKSLQVNNALLDFPNIKE